MKKLFSWITNLNQKLFHLLKTVKVKIRLRRLQRQINQEYTSLGKEIDHRDEKSSARYGIPLAQLKQNHASAITELEKTKETVTWKIHDFESTRQEYLGFISQSEEKVTQLKILLKNLQIRLRENKKKLDLKMALEKNSAKKFIVLTIYRSKEDYNKTLLELQKFNQEGTGEKNRLEQELHEARDKLSQLKNKWEKLQERFSIEIHQTRKEEKTIIKKNKQVEEKLNNLYWQLGYQIDEGNAYPSSLLSYQNRIRIIKEAIIREKDSLSYK
ncbi:MAG: hypothetical protein JW774_02465 [Candidatus Aureabacteria bacterium]|nr:hypothetical protein [Candidatus Auribacterota bacterium]